MVSEESLIEFISTTEIFLSLDAEYHKAIADVTEVRVFKSGARIVTQGERGQEYFLILSGSVKILLEDYALWTEQVLLELKAGQSFGESALLTDTKRSATVQAQEETTCAVLSRENFEKLMTRLPKVAMAVSRYLAQRLAVQCQLTGFRFVSGDDLVYDPKVYRAFPDSVLRRWRAVPLQLKGRNLTIALTRPNDPEAIKALQREVPGFGLEPVACTLEDYRAFLHRYRMKVQIEEDKGKGEPARVQRSDGTTIANPLRSVLASMQASDESQIIIEIDPNSAQLLVSQKGSLEPFLPTMVDDEALGLRGQLDELLGQIFERAGSAILSVKIGNRPCQLSVSVLKGRRKSRYAIGMTDVQSAVPPLRALFPSDATLNLVRGAFNEQGRILFLTGGKDSGLSTTLYSLLESRGEALDKRNILLFEERPLIPQDEILQFQLGRSLEPELSVASAQRPEIIAFDSLSPNQIEELVFHPDSESTVLATYRGDDLLDVLARTAREASGRAPSLHRISLILQQRLVRRVCLNCSEAFEPGESEMRRLRESGLDNAEGKYFHGKGCDVCGGTGVRGQVPLFEALRCSRGLLEGLAGLRSNREERIKALKDSLVFSYRSFARLLISQGLIDPLEGLRMFPARSTSEV